MLAKMPGRDLKKTTQPERLQGFFLILSIKKNND